jgi:hypothetical protein
MLFNAAVSAALQPKQQRASAAGGAAAAAELSSQLQALRQQLEAEQAARAAAEVRVEFLKGKVRDVADRSKQRGNMLAQLALAVRRVADAKQQLQVAEGEMQEALAAAEEYLQVRMRGIPFRCFAWIQQFGLCAWISIKATAGGVSSSRGVSAGGAARCTSKKSTPAPE